MSTWTIIAFIATAIWAFGTGYQVSDELTTRMLGAPAFPIWRCFIWPLEILWVILVDTPYQWGKYWLKKLGAPPSGEKEGEHD